MNRIFRLIKNVWKNAMNKKHENTTESKSDDNYPMW
jgi:hypothetical protein